MFDDNVNAPIEQLLARVADMQVFSVGDHLAQLIETTAADESLSCELRDDELDLVAGGIKQPEI